MATKGPFWRAEKWQKTQCDLAHHHDVEVEAHISSRKALSALSVKAGYGGNR